MRNYRNDNERYERRYDREERGDYGGHNTYGNRQDRYGQETYRDESRYYSDAFNRGGGEYNNRYAANQQGNQQGSNEQYGYSRTPYPQGQDHDYRREESRDWEGGQRYDRGRGEGYRGLETEYGDGQRGSRGNQGNYRGQHDYDRGSRGNQGDYRGQYDYDRGSRGSQGDYRGQYDYENSNRGGNYGGGSNYGGGNYGGGNYGGGNYGGGNYGGGNYGGGNYGGGASPSNMQHGGYTNAGGRSGQQYGESEQRGGYRNNEPDVEYGRGNYNDNYMREEERGYGHGPSSYNNSTTDAGYEGQYSRSDRSDSVFGMGPRSGRGTRGW